MSNVLVGLSIIQLDLSVKNNPPFILSKDKEEFVLPTVDIRIDFSKGDIKHPGDYLKITKESLWKKYIDISPHWANFNLIDVVYQDYFRHKDSFIIIYGCMVPFSTKIKEGFWLKTNIDNTEQFDIAIKTLRSFGNI